MIYKLYCRKLDIGSDNLEDGEMKKLENKSAVKKHFKIRKHIADKLILVLRMETYHLNAVALKRTYYVWLYNQMNKWIIYTNLENLMSNKSK